MATASDTSIVTRIKVQTNPDTLFDGGDFDPALCDQEATIAAYVEELAQEIQDEFPRARIDIREVAVYRTLVSIDTTLDRTLGDVEGEAARDAILVAEQRTSEAVDEAAARVWGRGTFWR